MSSQHSTPRQTCLRAEVVSTSTSSSNPQQTQTIFIKGVWFETHFSLAITDGGDAWLCDASEEDVRERASQWDQPVSEHIKFAEKYLGFQQPGSVYRFTDSGNGHRRLSWTFEKEGINLEWRWRCKPSSNCKKTTSEILDFLMEATIGLSEEVRKNQAFEQLKEDADERLVRSQRINEDKEEVKSTIFPKEEYERELEVLQTQPSGQTGCDSDEFSQAPLIGPTEHSFSSTRATPALAYDIEKEKMEMVKEDEIKFQTLIQSLIQSFEQEMKQSVKEQVKLYGQAMNQ